MKKLLLLVFSVVFSIYSLTALSNVNSRVVQIGISTSGTFSDYEDFLIKTISDLQGALTSRYSLRVMFLNDEELAKEIKENRLDLVIAPSSFARTYILQGARDIASLDHENSTNTNRAESSVFLVDGERTKATTLQEMQGKTVVTSKEFGLSGLASLLSTIAEQLKVKPDNFFKDIIYVPANLSDVLRTLKEGKAELAVVPACSLERYSQQTTDDTGWLRILLPRQDESLSCMHSAAPFPGIMVISMPSLSPYESKTITTALLGMDETDGMTWGVATDFSAIDRILQNLRNGPWQKDFSQTITEFAKAYWKGFAAAAAFILLLILHSIRSEFIVRKRTEELSKALEQQKLLHKEANLANRRYEKLQKISVIGQMSSLFAHELRQPLNAINCYANGLRRFLKNPEKAKAFIDKGIEGIEAEAERASAIVEQVRNYAKNKSSRQNQQDLKEILQRSIADFQTTSVGDMPVHFMDHGDDHVIRGEEFELELIFTNLLRNAAQAQSHLKSAVAWMEVSNVGPYVQIEIWDKGPALSEEKIKEISLIGDSTKAEGMGLGLSIIRTLVQAHSGEIRFSKSEQGGLKVTILLPLITSKNNQQEEQNAQNNN